MLDDFVHIESPLALASALGAESLIEHQQLLDGAIFGGLGDLLDAVGRFGTLRDAGGEFVDFLGFLGDAGFCLHLLDRPSLEHLVDAPVADGTRVDGRAEFLGDFWTVVLDVLSGVVLRESRPGQQDGVHVEMRESASQFGEEFRTLAGVLALARRPRKRSVLLGTVLGDGVNRRRALLDCGDGDVGVLGRLDRFLDALALVGLPDFLDFDLFALLDVQRVMVADLVLARGRLDGARHSEAVGEFVELAVLHRDSHRHRFALAASIPQLIVVALDASGRLPGDEVAGFEHVGEMPEVV